MIKYYQTIKKLQLTLSTFNAISEYLGEQMSIERNLLITIENNFV